MERRLYALEQVLGFIEEGRKMVLTADHQTLRQLPRGHWVGGTSPYFMDKDKGVFSKDMVFVDDFTDMGVEFRSELFDTRSMAQIGRNSYGNGFSVLILPLGAEVYHEFGLNSLGYKGIFLNPVVGYVAGFDLADPQAPPAMVFDGWTGTASGELAVALHVRLPQGKLARTEILNLNTLRAGGDQIVFPKTSFVQSDCTINGKPANIAEYLTESRRREKVDSPLITSMNGALINRDIMKIDTERGEVTFYSPAYAGDEHCLTNLIEDYQQLFNIRLREVAHEPCYTSICISYYMLGQLLGRKIEVEGAFAFGEISFQLLNMTLVLLMVEDD